MWLLSGVARAFKPGVQADYCLVLEGVQRAGKSSFLRMLAFEDEFFTDDMKKLGETESAKQLRSKWLVEFSELSSMRRTDLETTKAFITRRVDNYRPSYGKSALDFPRRCFFAGTVNTVGDRGYLNDPSGNERFWPVACEKIDRDLLLLERDQLWAEAVHRFRACEAWWPSDEERKTLLVPEQDRRREVDAWEETMRTWLRRSIVDINANSRPGHTTYDDVMTFALDIPKKDRNSLTQTRFTNTMHVLGWVPARVYENGVQIRAWTRGPTAEDYCKPGPAVRDVGSAYGQAAE